MMKLHWSPKSPYVRKVMICLEELNALERVQLVRSVAAMTKPNPQIMIDNPLSKIPTLVLDDGSSLFDSVVICEYLNDLLSGDMFPQSTNQKWTCLRWHAFGDGILDALILWRNERERQNPSENLINSFEFKVLSSLDTLERESTLLEQSNFDIGVISIICALGYLDYRFAALDWAKHAPKLNAWYLKIKQRPSVRKTEPVDG
jgi:glutathione S-transferase